MPRCLRNSFFAVAVCTSIGALGQSEPITHLSDQEVRVRLMQGKDAITFRVVAPATLQTPSGPATLPTGVYRIHASDATPARERFHLFSKTFDLTQSNEERAYMTEWRNKGARPERVLLGHRFQTDDGTVLDSRIHWISIAQFDDEAEATKKKDALYNIDQWTWMRGEIVEPGRAVIVLENLEDGRKYQIAAPFRLDPQGPMAVADVNTGFWKESRKNLSYTGRFTVEIGSDAKLELVLIVPLEEYLRGVVPSEMPAEWPLEALKAQAVAARSEVLVNLNTKHALEGVDFCALEHCRAYSGLSRQASATDRAIRATTGELLTDGKGIAVTVFSSNCGGWTENNDTVWRGPANSALRGRSDLRASSSASRLPPLSQWLRKSATAYCADDEKYFRWRRVYSQTELSDIVNKRHDVGRVKSIRLGERGVSGRLKWLYIDGTKGSVTVHKELPIRQALGGLPSAMFIIETSKGAQPRFELIGGGRGHGVGMCQHGARGMALSGMSYSDILMHYFTGVKKVRYR